MSPFEEENQSSSEERAEDSEGIRPVVATEPVQPTEKEREEHAYTHLPYRSWCPHCVRGKARAQRHKKATNPADRDKPLVAIDYTFMKTADQENQTTILVMKDTKYGAYFAYCVPQKGAAQEWIIKRITDDIESLGHRDIVLKADGENAIKEVQDKVRLARREGTVLENATRANSQANGLIEGANNIIKAQVRTIKDALDSRIGEKVHSGSTIMTWIVRYAAQLISRYSIGTDGKSAFRRIRGKECMVPVAEFGECVWYKPHEGVQPKAENKAEPRWRNGIWLGFEQGTNGVYIGTPEGVVRSGTIKRRPPGERWSAEAIKTCRGTPWDTAGRESTDGIINVDTGIEDVVGTRESQHVQKADYELQVTRRMINICGYTEGCRGCNFLKGESGQGGVGKAPQPPHNKECRQRVTLQMEKTAEGRRRLAERDKRLEIREETRQSRIIEKRERVEAEKKQKEENRKAEENRSKARGIGESQEWPKYTGQETSQEDQNEREIITPEEFVRIREVSQEVTAEGKRSREDQQETTAEEFRGPAKAARKEEQEAEQGLKRERTQDIEDESRKNAVRRINALINGEYYDDVTGGRLCDREAAEARKKEIEYFRKMQVYVKVPKDECWQKTGKAPIKTRWIDINKGDERIRNYRSRLVGKEIKKDNRKDLFAATPPLESLRFLLSDAVTGWERKRLMFIDVSRAYFYAKARRDVYVEIPNEDWEEGDEYRCGKLRLSMYGTRDAAQNWEYCYQEAFKELGFKPGHTSVCHLHHQKRGLKAVVHGDDFTITGSEEELENLGEKLKKKFEIKLQIMGPGPRRVKEQLILNRVVRWTDEGLEYEADPRHAEIAIREVQPKRGYITPIDKARNMALTQKTGRTMNAKDAAQYRGLAARLNYLALDRPDIAFACKEASRVMAGPEDQDWERLERLAGYLKTYPRLVYKYAWQKTGPLNAATDSDWAGCIATRKSTSGGYVTRGGHLIKAWAKTQPIIALSTAEAELMACEKGSTELMGMGSTAEDFGAKEEMMLKVDATACHAIVSRTGVGRVRHLDVRRLWIQEKAQKGIIRYMRVSRIGHVVDSFTKAATNPEMEAALKKLNLSRPRGRPATAPQLNSMANAGWQGCRTGARTRQCAQWQEWPTAPQPNSIADAGWQGCRTGTRTRQCAQWQSWPKQRR